MLDAGARIPVRGNVNGTAVACNVMPNELLIDVLREKFRLLGVKRSCDMQVCGACTVLLNGMPVSSCTTLAVELDGGDVETVEGMRKGAALSAVQQAFVDEGAIQCGFCTPGFVVASHALLREHPNATRETIIEYLDGNICRCSGYAAIVRAVERARDRMSADAGDSAAQGAVGG